MIKFNGNRANMLKLAEGLESGIVLEFAGKPVRFDMRNYGQSGCVISEETTCGSVGCAVGHATYFVEPKLEGEDWLQYAVRVLGPMREREFDYCFGQDWAATDNTRAGAAQRIRTVLASGVPEDWENPDEDNPADPGTFIV